MSSTAAGGRLNLTREGRGKRGDLARVYGSPHGRPAGAGVLYKSCLCRGRASRCYAHGVLLRHRLLLLPPSQHFH